MFNYRDVDRGLGNHKGYAATGTNSSRTASLRLEDVRGRIYQEKEPKVEQAALREAGTLDGRL